MTWTPADEGDLNGMIDRAERERKWMWCAYQDLWFSPAALRKANGEGRFKWGVVNWEIRDPQERVREAEGRVTAAQRELERIRAEVGGA